jgi:dihydroneopterin aldolase
MLETSLTIKKLEFFLNLGWGKEERAEKQSVFIDIHLLFSTPPKACETDELNDTLCYDTLIQKLKNEMQSKEFRLIEHTAHDIYHFIQSNLHSENKLKIQIFITKFPPIFGLTEGVCFQYGDKL